MRRRYAKTLKVGLYPSMYADLKKAFDKRKNDDGFKFEYRHCNDLQDWITLVAAEAMVRDFGVNPFDYA